MAEQEAPEMSGTILVVDDEASSRRILKLGLEAAGYEVDTAGDGVEALEKLRGDRFDVLITDMNMPRMDGQELCAAIRSSPEDLAPLIFVLTARVGVRTREWTESLEDIEFVEKPASLRRLVERVAERLADTGTAPEDRP